MKRKRHICAVLLCALVLAGLFTACGSSSNTAAADSASSGNSSSVPYDDALADEMGWAADTENSVTDSTSETAPSGSEILSQEKIIRTASMEIDVYKRQGIYRPTPVRLIPQAAGCPHTPSSRL